MRHLSSSRTPGLNITVVTLGGVVASTILERYMLVC